MAGFYRSPKKPNRRDYYSHPSYYYDSLFVHSFVSLFVRLFVYLFVIIPSWIFMDYESFVLVDGGRPCTVCYTKTVRIEIRRIDIRVTLSKHSFNLINYPLKSVALCVDDLSGVSIGFQKIFAIRPFLLVSTCSGHHGTGAPFLSLSLSSIFD